MWEIFKMPKTLAKVVRFVKSNNIRIAVGAAKIRAAYSS